MRKKAYSVLTVNGTDGRMLRRGHEGAEAAVGFDIGKEAAFAVVRWPDRVFERPRVFANPGEVRQAVAWVLQLAEGGKVRTGMEPSGTYGDPLRQALTDAQLPVDKVPSKIAHDYAEVFDGVPSQHDGKDAAVVAELVALGKGRAWPLATAAAWEEEMALVVDQLEVQRKIRVMWLNRLEGLLARHWPEATRLVPLRSSSLLRLLEAYGGPSGVAAVAPDQVEQQLWNWSRGSLEKKKAEALVQSARASVGVRQGEFQRRRLQWYAQQALAAGANLRESVRRLQAFLARDPVLQAMVPVVGATTACVLWAKLGNPQDYASAGAYRKAMGLNLAERSSGKYQGRLRISRRGPASVRHWLYLAALRLVRQEGVQQWYQAKRARDGQHSRRALVGVMRRLALALYRVADPNTAFEPKKLFSVRRRGR